MALFLEIRKINFYCINAIEDSSDDNICDGDCSDRFGESSLNIKSITEVEIGWVDTEGEVATLLVTLLLLGSSGESGCDGLLSDVNFFSSAPIIGSSNLNVSIDEIFEGEEC